MRSSTPAVLLAALVLAAGAGMATPAGADAIDDAPVPGLEAERRAPPPPVAAPPPPPEPAVVADAMDDEPEPGMQRRRRAAPADAPAPHGDPGWRFMVAPYVFLPSIQGDTTIDGFTSDVDSSFSDLFDDFDIFGLNGRGEAHKDRLGLFLDVMWLGLEGDFGTAAGVRVRPDTEIVKVDFGASWEVARWETSQGSITLAPALGGRYTHLKQQVTLRGARQGRTFGDRSDWWEPFVGGRLVWGVSEPFDITIAGDVGGFGVGSDLTWQAAGVLGFRFTEWFKLNMGYYVYDVDWSSGSGRGEQGYDVRHHGPRIGFQFDL